MTSNLAHLYVMRSHPLNNNYPNPAMRDPALQCRPAAVLAR